MPFDPYENFISPSQVIDIMSPKPPLPAISRANTDSRLPELHVTAQALAKLRWSAEKNHNEFTFWGIIEVDQESGGFVMKDAILAKHASDPGYCDPDMEWYGDLVMDKFADEGIQPWQLACWIHTHPHGMDTPSGHDIDTFQKSLGDQRLSLMVIMTKDLKFWGRMSAIVQPFDGVSAKTYSASPLRFTFEDPNACATPEQAAELDTAYPSLWEEYIRPRYQAPAGRGTLISTLGEEDEDESMVWSGLTRYFTDDEEVEEDDEERYLIDDNHNEIFITRAAVLNYLAYFAEVSADGVMTIPEDRAFDLEHIADGLMDDQSYYGPSVADAVIVRNALRKIVKHEETMKEVQNALVGKQ